jgi:hypothetical protein
MVRMSGAGCNTKHPDGAPSEVFFVTWQVLKSHSKKRFDVFKRGEPIVFPSFGGLFTFFSHPGVYLFPQIGHLHEVVLGHGLPREWVPGVGQQVLQDC